MELVQMKVTLFPTDGSSCDDRVFHGVDVADQVNDVALLDGVTHTDVESMRVRAEVEA